MRLTSRKDTDIIEKKGPDIPIKRSPQGKNYAFAKPLVVKAGHYRSVITGVEVTQTKAGEEAVDVLYTLTNAEGMVFHVRMRYPRDSYYWGELCNALLAAGLKDGESIMKAVGVQEEITLDYVNGETIGSITSRSPIGKKTIQKKVSEVEETEEDEDTDDEFDDFLSDGPEDEE